MHACASALYGSSPPAGRLVRAERRSRRPPRGSCALSVWPCCRNGETGLSAFREWRFERNQDDGRTPSPGRSMFV